MAFVRYHETERLFAAWPELEAILNDLLLDLAITRARDSLGTSDDYIYGLCFGNKAAEYVPSGNVSDPTGNIVANYGSLMRHDRWKVKRELYGEAHEIAAVIDNLKMAFRRITSLQRVIIRTHYIEGMSWKDTAIYLSLSERQTRREARRAINKLIGKDENGEDGKRILRITIKTYEKMMRMVKERTERGG